MVLSLFTGLLLAANGCSGSSDDGAAGDESDITKAKGPGKEGGICAGIANIQCDKGLSCTNVAKHPDASGTCAKAYAGAKAGETCGGIAGIQCEKGLSCEGKGNYPDAAGKCAKAYTGAKAGETCGGIANIQCQKGLSCEGKGNYPDAAGKCAAGTACGFATCASGTVCCDALHGTCVKPGMSCTF